VCVPAALLVLVLVVVDISTIVNSYYGVFFEASVKTLIEGINNIQFVY